MEMCRTLDGIVRARLRIKSGDLVLGQSTLVLLGANLAFPLHHKTNDLSEL